MIASNIQDIPKKFQKCYKNRPGLKAAGVQLNYTQEQINEYLKCKEDPIFFIKNYCKIVHIDRGVIPFELYPFQENFVNTMHNNNKTILCTARQVGKTITSASYFLWYAMFNDHKDSAILANKGSTAYEIMHKLQMIYQQIPFWLQTGLVEWNKSSMELENGSRIFCETTSANSIRGYSISQLFLDEFAFVDTNKATEFFTSVYPTLSSGKNTKIIIASTPNGLNHFYKTYQEACEGRNGFAPCMVKWDSVPGRTEKWAADQRRVLGDAMFCQEHEADFQGSSNTLISSYYIKNMVFKTPIHSADGFDMLEMPIKDHIYMMTVDTARGVENDYSALIVFDATSMPYKTVGKYRSDHIPPILFPTIIHKIATDYNMAHVLVETNDLGAQVVGILHNDLEYENVIFVDKDRVSNWGKGGVPGFNTNQKTKRMGCAALKTLVENESLIITDFDTIVEVSTFVQVRGSFAGDNSTHDDLAMCLVLFAWLANQVWFRDITDVDIRKMMFAAKALELENSLIPPGILDFGHDEIIVEEVVLTPDCIWADGSISYNDFVRDNYMQFDR